MMNWTDVVMCEERYKDYVREAAQEPLIRQAQAGRPAGVSFLARVAAWLKQHAATGNHRSHRTLAGPSRA